MGKTVLMQGNEACVEGALAAGMRLYAGYPITPSTEIAELSALRLPQEGGKFIQMEDEIASIACAIGASVAGVKAMTATSGPGFSLKQENIGYACLAEIPMVIGRCAALRPIDRHADVSVTGRCDDGQMGHARRSSDHCHQPLFRARNIYARGALLQLIRKIPHAGHFSDGRNYWPSSGRHGASRARRSWRSSTGRRFATRSPSGCRII